MKQVILTVVLICFSIFVKAQNPSEILNKVISKIESCKTISHYSKQKWGNIGDINDFAPLAGTCTFKLSQSDTVIKAQYSLKADNGITDFYSGDKLTRINQKDNSQLVTDLKKYPREKNYITAKMLYSASVIDIYNIFLEAKKGIRSIQQLKDTIIQGKIAQKVSLVYTDTIINNIPVLFKKIISVDKSTCLPIHYISISKSEYGTQIIENLLSNYKINIPLDEKFFYGGKIPSYYKTTELMSKKDAAPKNQLSVNQPAPEFKLPIVQGGDLDLSSLKGKTVLLVFSGVHCGFCLVALKDLKKIIGDFNPDQFKIISVYSDSDKNDLKKYIEKRQIPYPIIFNGEVQKNDYHILDKYGVSGIPHFILIDKNGLVKWNSVGYSSDLYESLTNEISKLVN